VYVRTAWFAFFAFLRQVRYGHLIRYVSVCDVSQHQTVVLCARDNDSQLYLVWSNFVRHSLKAIKQL